MPKVLTKREFITKATRLHENKFDYTKVYYKNNYTKVCIICPLHGEFWQRPGDHLMGKSCAVCGGTKLKSNIHFIQDALKTHGDVYDYSKVEYKNNRTKVITECFINNCLLYVSNYGHDMSSYAIYNLIL